jgi:NAD(P)-dependent dehydrogenase (short-subunit alcohol dehydrogenase family)
MRLMQAEAQIAIVTGAERGLGLAVSRALAARGFTVIPTSRDIKLARQVANELVKAGGQAIPYQVDVIDDKSVEKFATQLTSNVERADLLINNAGICIDTVDQASLTSLDLVRDTLETNLFGAWRMCKAFLPLMVERGHGRIINISSKMGQLETMGTTSPGYRVSKTALNALTCMLAAEVEGTGVLVNSVEPGWMKTEMGGPDAPRSAEDGAETVIWAATSNSVGTGCFYFDRRLIPW